jgi:hypothetical protein
MAKPRPPEPFRSTRAPRITARPPEDPAIAQAQAALNQTLMHIAPMSHEYTDKHDRLRPKGATLPHGTDLKSTSALRPAQRRVGPAAEILLGPRGSADLSSTATTAILGGTSIPFDQLGTTLDRYEPLPIDPDTSMPPVDAEVQRLTTRLQRTGQMGSSSAVSRDLHLSEDIHIRLEDYLSDSAFSTSRRPIHLSAQSKTSSKMRTGALCVRCTQMRWPTLMR